LSSTPGAAAVLVDEFGTPEWAPRTGNLL